MDQYGTQMSVVVPSGVTVGYNYITVKGTSGSNTSLTPFTVIGAGPYIDSFPQTAGIGSSITLTGAHFSGFAGGGGSIKFAGMTTSASYYAPTTDQQLTVIVPNNGVTGPLTATTSAGTWTSTNNFYYPPKVTSFSPANGRPGTNVVIKGTNFFGVTTVSFGGFNAVSFTTNSNFQITATIPEFATSGVVRVFTPGGQFVSSSNFFVLPDIVSFSPAVGDVGTLVTINGTNLNGSGLKVYFNGVQASIASTNGNQLQAYVPSGAMSGAITVQSSDGTASSLSNFYMPPTISLVAPTSASPGGTVTITGRNFTNATAVLFNGVNPASFTVVGNTQINATVPSGWVSGQITVVTPGGSVQSDQYFYGAPVINAVTPPAGVVGVDVTIWGTNFFYTTNLTFNGVKAPINTQTATNITTTVPFGATTGPIRVQTYGGNVSSGTFFIEPLVLSITNLDTNVVQLSWTTNAPGFQLQSAVNLLSTNTVWSNDTNATQVIGGLATVTEATTNAPQKSYRLRK